MIDDTCDWITQGLRSPDHLPIPDFAKESLMEMQILQCKQYCPDRACNIKQMPTTIPTTVTQMPTTKNIEGQTVSVCDRVSFAEQDRTFNQFIFTYKNYYSDFESYLR